MDKIEEVYVLQVELIKEPKCYLKKVRIEFHLQIYKTHLKRNIMKKLKYLK